MGRWLFLASCLAILAVLLVASPALRPSGRAQLSDRCDSSFDCQRGLSCSDDEGVLAGQCAASCSTDGSCQERFGQLSMCIGIDQCVRACDDAGICPSGTACNGHGWCEAVGENLAP